MKKHSGSRLTRPPPRAGSRRRLPAAAAELAAPCARGATAARPSFGEPTRESIFGHSADLRARRSYYNNYNVKQPRYFCKVRPKRPFCRRAALLQTARWRTHSVKKRPLWRPPRLLRRRSWAHSRSHSSCAPLAVTWRAFWELAGAVERIGAWALGSPRNRICAALRRREPPQSCQRYWTAGGTLRNVQPGAGKRKAAGRSGSGGSSEKTTEELLRRSDRGGGSDGSGTELVRDFARSSAPARAAADTFSRRAATATPRARRPLQKKSPEPPAAAPPAPAAQWNHWCSA